MNEGDLDPDNINQRRVLSIDPATGELTFATFTGGSLRVTNEFVNRYLDHEQVADGMREYQRNRDAAEEPEAKPGFKIKPGTTHYVNRTFGRLLEVDTVSNEAVFQTDPDAETVAISLDMLKAVAEALVKAGAVSGQKAVDETFRATGVAKPQPPKPVTIESSIEFLVNHVKRAGDADAIFAKGGEIMQQVSMAVIEVTKATNDDED